MANHTLTPLAAGPLEVSLSDQEFNDLRQLIYKQFGINLTDQKKTLVHGRLKKVLRDRKFSTFQEYFLWLKAEKTGAGLEELANRISTNHTYFNREKQHFEFFSQTALPELVSQRQKQQQSDLRIWCAGCSSGEEPYTLMMLMMEYFGPSLDQWNPMLLATDLSETALNTARVGVYPPEKVSQLPRVLQGKYFNKLPDGSMAVKEEVRRRILFRRHNLMGATYSFNNLFDSVFCRNVMIYFDRETSNTLVEKFYKHTVDNGYLFIGHSEALVLSDTAFNFVIPAVYKK